MGTAHKQIAFDLDTKALKRYYSKDGYQNAYYDIRRVMEKEGFMWQQGSVYRSKKQLERVQTTIIIRNMLKRYPWLNFCMRDCTVTNIGKDYSLNHLFDVTVQNGV